MGNIFSGGNQAAGEEGEQQRGFFANPLAKYILLMLLQLAIRNFFMGKKNPRGGGTVNQLPTFENAYYHKMDFDIFFHLAEDQFSFSSLSWEDMNEVYPLIWHIPDISYEYKIFSKGYKKEVKIAVNEEVLAGNKNLFVIVTIIPHNAYLQRKHILQESILNEEMIFLVSRSIFPLIVEMKPFTKEELLNLMADDIAELRTAEKKVVIEDPEKYERIIRHLKLRFDAAIIGEKRKLTEIQLKDPIIQHIRKIPDEDSYKPLIVSSSFWLLQRDYIPLEDIKDNNVDIKLNFGIYSVRFWEFSISFDAAMEMHKNLGLKTQKEMYMLKRIILDTNPWMLGFSAILITLHSIFSIFAFKSDMQFWYENKSMKGLSALSIIFGLVCKVIIGLYLYASEKASWLLLFEAVLDIGLSVWKVTKAVEFVFLPNFPYVKIKNAKNYVESNTKEYDQVAIKWMSIFLLPCTLGYSIYALYYYKYKSWFSYIISVLAGVVYTFGFVMMTPQLYINYKLKSVDHLPWKALIYRSLNTFIDDVAFFLIDMPLLHRLSCFRDDIIFLIYIYQRWIYKVDNNRSDSYPTPAAIEADKTATKVSNVISSETVNSSIVSSANSDVPDTLLEPLNNVNESANASQGLRLRKEIPAETAE